MISCGISLHTIKGKIFLRFSVESLLFNAGIRNSTKLIFITCNGLNDVRTTAVHKEVYKSKRFLSNFTFTFTSKSVNDLTKLVFLLLNRKKISLSLLSFK